MKAGKHTKAGSGMSNMTRENRSTNIKQEITTANDPSRGTKMINTVRYHLKVSTFIHGYCGAMEVDNTWHSISVAVRRFRD